MKPNGTEWKANEERMMMVINEMRMGVRVMTDMMMEACGQVVW